MFIKGAKWKRNEIRHFKIIRPLELSCEMLPPAFLYLWTIFKDKSRTKFSDTLPRGAHSAQHRIPRSQLTFSHNYVPTTYLVPTYNGTSFADCNFDTNKFRQHRSGHWNK